MIEQKPWRSTGDIVPGQIVCVADHASNHVPDDIDLGIPAELLDDHIAYDIGVGGIADRLACDHRIAAHIATVSRLVCDFHREEDNPAVVPEASDGHTIPGNIGADVEKRLDFYHRPYHAALERFLQQARPSLILSIHSFTPRLATSNEARPWQVALLYNEHHDPAQHAIRLLRDEGFTVGENEPYSGKELNATMNRHAEAHGRPYLAIEIRQDEILTEAQQARWAATLSDIGRRTALAIAAE